MLYSHALTELRVVVLGSPGSGCSTLLKTLTNQRSEYHSVEGNVYYDSLSPDDVRRHYRGDIQYSPEDDIHFPTLTVGETVTFAAKMRAPRLRVHERTRKEFTSFVRLV
jgi:ATP-binding cassette, subfamily G (WHITE), member 2, SNQ2